MLSITRDMYNDMEYNGSESKCGVTINGTRYILKRHKNNWNNVMCEYVASNTILVLGGDAHITSLALEDGNIVVLCRDFQEYAGKFVTMGAINTSDFDTYKYNYDYMFNDIQYELKKLKRAANNIVDKFIEMYVFDTILGNPDRHPGNWGICIKDGVKRLSPIFDNGASLFPRANYNSISEEWLRERIYVWPNSKIMFNSRERSSYFNVWRGHMPEYAREFAHSLDIRKAIDWIHDQEYLSDTMKWFYSLIVLSRYNAIIKGEKYEYESYCKYLRERYS